jgi:hypothetical protein
MTMNLTGLRLGVLFLALILGAGTGFAQVTASITGRVDDPSSAGIPGTTVTVTSKETGATRTVNSDEVGNYQVLSLLDDTMSRPRRWDSRPPLRPESTSP